MEFVFYDLAEDVTITTTPQAGLGEGASPRTTTVAADPNGELQSVEVDISMIHEVIVTFAGRGAIASIGVCRDPSTPPPQANSSPSATIEPTSIPTLSPTPETASCPEDVVLVATVGDTPPPSVAIEVLEYGGDQVTFNVRQVFNSTVNIFAQYHEHATGETDCFEEDNVVFDETMRYTAYCMKCVPLTIVDLWFTDTNAVSETSGDAVVPPCCHPPSEQKRPTVQYTYKVYCESRCPAEDGTDNRRMLSEIAPPVDEGLASITDASNVTKPKDSDDVVVSADDHMCLSKDYPCNGDMVYICHYSARHGYETFCVPESDSDIVGYFPRSTCGPCEGDDGYEQGPQS
uniref:Uncharacterized protein n=1 Tax=Craspedostauros australis TaxID=1486917 RepID=A0A7R9WZE8_9STRA